MHSTFLEMEGPIMCLFFILIVVFPLHIVSSDVYDVYVVRVFPLFLCMGMSDVIVAYWPVKGWPPSVLSFTNGVEKQD